jgi:type IV pilus assembly protein PilA
MIILAILMAIAVPSYLGFKDRANDSAAKSDVRAAIPSIEAYAGDNNDSYTGATATILKTKYDTGLASSVVVTPSSDGKSYCVAAGTGSHTWSATGPGADFSLSTTWHNNGTCA